MTALPKDRHGRLRRTAEYADLRAAVREITLAHGPAEFADHARTGHPQSGLWSDLGKAGFIGINVPAEYGGGGAGMSELVVVAEELAAAGCPLLLILVSSAIAVEVLARHGTAAQKQEWLTQLSDGSVKVAFAITEPDAGSNSHHITTTAVRDGDDYLITGSKYYISGVDESARDPDRRPLRRRRGHRQGADVAVHGPDRRRRVVLERAAGGGPDSGQAVHRVLRPGPGAGLGADRVEGEGLRPLFDGLNPERIAGAALGVGVGRYALEVASRYATCGGLGMPIGAHQGVAHPLAKAKIEVELAALMTAKAAWLHDQGLPAGEASNMAKYAAAEAAVGRRRRRDPDPRRQRTAVEYGLIPLWGMARLLQIAPVNREMVLNYVAQHTLHLPRSY